MKAKESYAELRRKLALALKRDGAFLTRESDHPLVVTRGWERGFKLQLHDTTPEAPLSPYFYNIRVSDNPTKPGTVTPETVALAAECMHRLAFMQELYCNCVVGVPNAGDPFAKEYCKLVFGAPRLQLIKGMEGGKRVIKELEGLIPPVGMTALVIDDLITKAGSKFLAINVLVEKYQLVVRDVLVIVDREEGGREELAVHDIALHSVFTTTELLDLYLELGAMTSALHADIMAYIATSRAAAAHR